MSERFAPKVPVQLDPPKDDPISPEELAKCDGTKPSYLPNPTQPPLCSFPPPHARLLQDSAKASKKQDFNFLICYVQALIPAAQPWSLSRALCSTSPATRPTVRQVNIAVCTDKLFPCAGSICARACRRKVPMKLARDTRSLILRIMI